MSKDKETFQILSAEERKFMLPSPFRRKTEALDWKKIASIDIDKIIQTSNTELLEELQSQIIHCRPEIEFESNADSGFLKVFKLSQLIIGYFQRCQEAVQEKYEKMALKYAEAEEQRAALSQETQSLRESLSAAKKELRRRKELLVSAQSEVVGDNKDEYDPCPYCSKRFLTTAYLMAHMQRRHQGLPFQPPFPAQNIFNGFPPKFVENDYNNKQYSPGQPQSSHMALTVSSAASQATQGTQTESKSAETVVPDAEMITALIEKCLKEKSKSVPENIPEKKVQIFQSVEVQVGDSEIKSGEDTPNTQSDQKSSEQGSTSNTISKEKDEAGESVKNIMAEIKHQLDLQWQFFSGKIQDNELEELKSTLQMQPGELRTLRLISSPMLSPAHVRVQNVLVADAEQTSGHLAGNPPKSPMPDQVEERFQRQQEDLEALRKLLQTKMETDIKTIEGKLESQERYWRSKLRLVEEEYDYQLKKLRQEFQSSLKTPERPETQNNLPLNIIPKPSGDTQAERLEQPKVPEATGMFSSKANVLPSTAPSVDNKAAAPTSSKVASKNAKESMSPAITIPEDTQSEPEEIDTAKAPEILPVPKPRGLVVISEPELPHVPQQVISVKTKPEVEEPEDVFKFDQVQEYSSEEESTDDLSHEQVNVPEKPEVLTEVPKPDATFDEEDSAKISKFRDQVAEEINNQLQALGLDPNAPEISPQDMKRISKQFQARRDSLQSRFSGFNEQQEAIKQDVESAVIQKNIRDRLGSADLAVTPEKATRSPLTKVLAAVKMSGKRMHKRVKSAITKTPKPRKSPTLPTTSKSAKAGLFSRARWGRRKKSPPSVKKEDLPNPDLEETSSEYSESASESELDVEVQYTPRETLPRSRTSTPLKVQLEKVSRVESSESEPEDVNVSLHKKKKSSVRSNKASRLRYREAERKIEVKHEKQGSLKRPVRRSLDAEFDQVTPKKVVEKVSVPQSKSEDSTSDATEDEVSSSWEEEVQIGNAGEYLDATPRKTPEQIQKTVKTPEGGGGKHRVGSWTDGTKPENEEVKKCEEPVRGKATVRPVTARPRIALDSWDVDEELEEKVRVPNKPAFVTQRWNDEPVPKGRRTPMSVIISSPGPVRGKIVQETPVKKTGKEKAEKHSQRDSPLNNSWDSN